MTFKKHFDLEVLTIRALREFKKEIFSIKSISRTLDKEGLLKLLESYKAIEKN